KGVRRLRNEREGWENQNKGKSGSHKKKENQIQENEKRRREAEKKRNQRLMEIKKEMKDLDDKMTNLSDLRGNILWSEYEGRTTKPPRIIPIPEGVTLESIDKEMEKYDEAVEALEDEKAR